MRAAVAARGPAIRLRLAALVFCALAHLADVMLGIKFEAELGHEIELGLGGLLIKRADISAARSEALLDRKCFSRPPFSAAAPGAPSRG